MSMLFFLSGMGWGGFNLNQFEHMVRQKKYLGVELKLGGASFALCVVCLEPKLEDTGCVGIPRGG